MKYKWTFETLNEYINSKYENIKLLDILETRKSKKIKRYIKITNGERTREMLLGNFLLRGCDFYEKTDKRITLEYVIEKTKDYFNKLNISVNILKIKHLDSKNMIHIYLKYKENIFIQNWASFLQDEKMTCIENFLNKEKITKDKYGLELLKWDKDTKRFVVSNGIIKKDISTRCFYSGQFTVVPMEDKTDEKIKQFIISNYPKCEILNINRKPYSKTNDKNYIFVELKYKNKIYEVEYGLLKKGFNFHSKEPIGEKIIKDLLNKRNIEYEPQKTFEDLKNINKLKYDFYLPSYNAIIECNGIQHYEPIDNFGGIEAFEINKKRDKIKEDYAINNGIKLYIIDRSYEFSANKIKKFIADCHNVINKIVSDYNERQIPICERT